MKPEIIATRGHLVDSSEEWAALGHLVYSYAEPSIISQEMVVFELDLDIANSEVFVGDFADGEYNTAEHLRLVNWRGQQFTVASEVKLVSFDIQIWKQNNPVTPMYIELYEMDAITCKPVGSPLESLQISETDPKVPLINSVWTNWSFSTTPTLSPSKVYALIGRSGETAINKWRWCRTEIEEPYNSCGDYEVSTNNSGVSWSLLQYYKLIFRIYAQTPITKCIDIETELEYVDSVTMEFDLDLIIEDNLILDQSCQEATDGGFNNVYIDEWHGQQFIPSVTGIVSFLKLGLTRDNYQPGESQYPLVVDIYEADGSGFPMGPSLSHTEIDVGQIAPENGPAEFNNWQPLPIPPVNLTSGKMYIIVLSNYDAIGYIDWWAPETYPSICYPLGIDILSEDQGTSWQNTPTLDYRFQEFVGTLDVSVECELALEVFAPVIEVE